MEEEKTKSKARVQLYGTWSSPYVIKIKWALSMKGIEYEYIEEDLKNKSSSLLQYNPVYKKVPVLVHDGKPVVESIVILEYIEETWSNNPLMPQDPYMRAMTRFWCKFGDDKLISLWYVLINEGEEQKKACETAIENLEILEKGVFQDSSKFMNGDTIGLLDLYYGPIAYSAPIFEQISGMNIIQQERLPLLSKWMQNFTNDPNIKDLLPPRDELLHKLSTMRQAFLLKEN